MKATKIPTTPRPPEPSAAHSAREAVDRLMADLDRLRTWQPLAARLAEIILLRELAARLAPVLLELGMDAASGGGAP